MIVLPASYEILSLPARNTALQRIEFAGRTAYKSEDKITETSASTFVEKICKNKHESVIEHVSATVKFVVDRGVSHEIVRHRLASYTQESTRYCNYAKKGLTFIKPCFFDEKTTQYQAWRSSMLLSEETYLTMLKMGCSPEEARCVLPNSLKTEIIVTANFREWLHIFRMRTHKTAHPQMREVMVPLRDYFASLWPEIYGVFG